MLRPARGERSSIVLAYAERPGGPATTLAVEIRRSADGVVHDDGSGDGAERPIARVD
jgi:hypothetical protein